VIGCPIEPLVLAEGLSVVLGGRKPSPICAFLSWGLSASQSFVGSGAVAPIGLA